MPELPEVQTVVARLHQAIGGALVKSARLRRRDIIRSGPGEISRRLRGKIVRRVRRHGKRIIWELDSGVDLNVHLGMTGNLLICPPGMPLQKHAHLVVGFEGLEEQVRFVDPRRFGGIWLSGDGTGPTAGRFSSELGPDALEIRLPEFRSRLQRTRQIKALLLDQNVIAGLGNIYTDEALYLSRIHPLQQASSLSRERVADLLRAIRKVLRAAIAAGGSSISDYRTADGEMGGYQKRHRAYGRQGRPCGRCRTLMLKTTVASRATCYCPKCQVLS